MLGLPLETALLVFGAPLLWALYTLVFWIRTRDWDSDDRRDEDA